MSLKMFFDAACTEPILTAEKFTAGMQTLTLTAFTGAQLGGVYKEVKTTHSGIQFVNGVGSGFSGLVPGQLKGNRVVFGNTYIGQVYDNNATSITVSNTQFTTSIPGTCYTSAYYKLYTPLDFTLSSNEITLVTMPEANEYVHAVPINTLAMYFGGGVGNAVTKSSHFFLQRDPNFEYTALQVSSDDTSIVPFRVSADGIVFNAGVGSGFSGLSLNSLVGKAVNHDGLFCGIVTANTDTTVTVNSNYTGVAAIAEIYNVGTLLFSIDGIQFYPVIHPADLTAVGGNVRRIYFKDTVNIPVAAINYPSTIIKVYGVEYIA